VRAFVITGPQQAEVREVPAPTPRPGEAVVEVERVGVCGTDVAFFTGEMPFLHDGNATYPMRIGHEWMGTVTAVGQADDEHWLGQRVTGDTMLGCRSCERCRSGRQHLCDSRLEVGVRGGKDGALAEQVCVPVSSLFGLPDVVDATAGALVEPGGNALRSVQAANVHGGSRVLIIGPGTIGLLAAMFARAKGVEVHLLGRSDRSLAFARSLGFAEAWTQESLPDLPFDAVINASTSGDVPARAVELVEPGRRVVYVGLAGSGSSVDSRSLVFKDLTAVGILSGSPGAIQTISAFADGSVDPRPLVADTVGLDGIGAILAGERPRTATPAPKFHVDPRMS